MHTPGLIEPYLYFNGNCFEALTYYERVFGGTITYLQQWKDVPKDIVGDSENLPGAEPHQVMHASLKIGGLTLMASDNPYMNTAFGDSITLNWSHQDEGEVKRVWQQFVADGAEISMALEPSFFSPLFGSLTDTFGINWQIMQWNPEDSELE